MSSALIHRPQWAIDRVLEELRGENVRVAAAAFSPTGWTNENPRRFISPRDLILPDNTLAAGLPLYFEGRLQDFVREIGVVHVHLESPVSAEPLAEGVVCFRGTQAVVLRGPASVRLAYPFHVEKLPPDDANYWRDLQFARVQFKLPL